MQKFLFGSALALCLLIAPGCGGPGDEEEYQDEVFYDGDEKTDSFTPRAGPTRSARGNAWDYDPGPPRDSRWPQLFALTPNYRQLGIRVLGGAALRDEKFRWEFGPMYYRGRLTPNSVKVFIVGQEGAQDESVSNRAFTGSTGTKMQKFLNSIGITQSYLFMNTFVYTIHGQYAEMDGTVSPKVRWLAQGPDSPLVKHRHAMFNYMQEQNQGTLQLIIGVGQAGRDSVVTWVQSRWNARTPGSGAGKCPSITRCDASVIAPGMRVLGLPHPGAASPRNGGEDSLNSLSSQFKRAVGLVASWVRSSPGWLPPDLGGTTRFTNYSYTNAPIPHRDFPFASMDILGDWGTTSNRRDGDQAIQVYSDEGCYNNAAKDPATGRCYGDPNDPSYKTIKLDYDYPPDLETSIAELPPGDLAWESPRQATAEFDPGPPSALAKLLGGGESGFPMPNFAALGVTQHPSFGVTWYYRGRLTDAKTLVLADQDAQDDMFCARALCGGGGQRLQTFLKLMNAGTSYAILRSLPVDTLDLPADKALAIATDGKVLALLGKIVNTVIQQSGTRLIITVGPMAREQMARIGAGMIRVVNLEMADNGLVHVKGWQDALRALGVANTYTGRDLTAIPRIDLPIHTKWWVGTSGTRGSRAFNVMEMRQDPNYYKISMPRWVARLQPPPLSAEEEAAVKLAPQ